MSPPGEMLESRQEIKFKASITYIVDIALAKEHYGNLN
jgi:hypothetical protein